MGEYVTPVGCALVMVTFTFKVTMCCADLLLNWARGPFACTADDRLASAGKITGPDATSELMLRLLTSASDFNGGLVLLEGIKFILLSSLLELILLMVTCSERIAQFPAGPDGRIKPLRGPCICGSFGTKLLLSLACKEEAVVAGGFDEDAAA